MGQQLTRAQQAPCSSALRPEEPSSGPEIAISDVTFSGFIQLPISDQDQIVASLKQQKYTSPLDGVVEEALERVKAGWQNHGYFRAEVSGEVKTMTTSAANLQIALFVHVQENGQYRLDEITFKNNKVLSDSAKLRDLFPITNGEIFSREKVATGLENLRKVYGQYGYINYTDVPSTTFDDERKLAHLVIDIDEGKQFYIGAINFLGVDEATQREIMRDSPFKAGQIYNSRLYDLFLSQHASLFPNCECRDSEALRLNEKTGIVTLTMDVRPCSEK